MGGKIVKSVALIRIYELAEDVSIVVSKIMVG